MPVTQINDGNKLNEAGGQSIRNRSLFINKFPIGGTYRFGEYGICFAAETVPDDRHTIHLGHNIISNTLKAPLLQDVILKKDLFWVPDMAILPLNWEKFFVNPVKGEDVPNDVGCCVEHFGNYMASFLNNWLSEIYTRIGDYSEPDADDAEVILTTVTRFAIFLESVYSEGSLLAALQSNLSGVLGADFNFGDWFDRFVDFLQKKNCRIVYDSTNYFDLKDNAIATREALANMRDDPSYSVVPLSVPSVNDFTVALDALLDEITISDADFPLNLRRLWAYQLVCAHFYTNDKIDYVFSAELYRQLVRNCYIDYVSAESKPLVETFTVNGLVYEYDYLSAHYFNKIVTFASGSDFVSSSFVDILHYFRLLFGYNASLRYLDYFTGSRSQPLAVGDSTVAVNANKVNVVEIAASTMAAKMRNVINRVGQRIEAYVKELFGVEMDKDYHNPFWLAHTSDQIDNPENQNTADQQYSKTNSITSIFRTGGNSEAFETTIDRAGVIIGISYFDIQRVYPRSINRQFFHVDRYDDFLPYLQYVGDQPVFQMELDSSLPLSNFAYTGRNMEYKQAFPYCFGGFHRDLAPYVFLADDGYKYPTRISMTIGPRFIRCNPTELDRFFNILNGYSLETYYHFAIVNNIYWEASRPMAALPGILNG